MRELSLEPDENMRWIYDPSHRDYSTDEAKYLRERRAAAIRNAPAWMVRGAEFSDALRKKP